MSREIVLSNGAVALVDDSDYDLIVSIVWHCSNGYARGRVAGKYVYMHRFLLGVKGALKVDHINRNTLDNRRSNLRAATNRQNARNRIGVSKTSSFKGVSWSTFAGKWRAVIMVDGRNIHLGYFAEESAAAKAYDTAAMEYHGEFARANPPLMGDRRAA